MIWFPCLKRANMIYNVSLCNRSSGLETKQSWLLLAALLAACRNTLRFATASLGVGCLAFWKNSQTEHLAQSEQPTYKHNFTSKFGPLTLCNMDNQVHKIHDITPRKVEDEPCKFICKATAIFMSHWLKIWKFTVFTCWHNYRNAESYLFFFFT